MNKKCFLFDFTYCVKDLIRFRFKIQATCWNGLNLVFYAYLIHYFYNSKNKGERQKRTSDSDSTSKNT